MYPYVNPLPHLGSTLLQVGKGPSLRGRDVHEERAGLPLLERTRTSNCVLATFIF
ncbi:hypothetical protein SHP1_042 [Salmonella phage SHP1]|nr:hypothetical protein SHP1_042 [Salmonella phage SHP1]